MPHYRATHMHFPAPSLAAAAAGVLLLAAVPQEAAAQRASTGGISGRLGGSVGATSVPSALNRANGALSTSRPLSTTAPSVAVPGALPPSAIGAPAPRVLQPVAPAPVSPLSPSESVPSALGGSAIGTPAPRVQPVAPLSPPTTSTFLGRGETTVTLPNGITTTVPSEVGTTATFRGGGSTPAATGTAPPSTPGGGGDTFEACMGFWDAQTHMTKQEWARSCRRVMNRLQDLQKELGPPPAASARVARRRSR